MNYLKTETGLGTIIEKKGAWLTVDFDGEIEKIRSSADLEILTDEDIAMMSEFGDQTDFTMDDLEEEEVHTMSNQLKRYRPRYVTHDDAVSESGRKVVDNNDEVAAGLRGMWIETLYPTVAKILGVPESELRERYGHLNKGQQSMNLRNRVRGHLNRVKVEV
jgi:ElaB/YqjD/DUF883 family membrane-anchored ribosome-binding protein